MSEAGDTSGRRGSRSSRRPPEERPGLLYWLGDLFANRGKELFATAVISVVGIVAYALWGTFEDRARGFVVESVLAELDKGNRLTEPIQKILQQTQSSQVGSLDVGTFWLTPTNRAYTLNVYFPTSQTGKYTGKIFCRLKGTTENKYVVLLMPDGERIPIWDGEVAIDLEKYVKTQGSLERQGIEGIVETSKELSGHQTITFQLAGTAVDAPAGEGALPSGVEVKYVSFVTPAIQIDK